MSSIDVSDYWRRCLVIMNVTRWQWEHHSERKRALTEDEILNIEMHFLDLKYYTDTYQHNCANLLGFYDRLKTLNEKLKAAAIKMGFTVKTVSGDNF